LDRSQLILCAKGRITLGEGAALFREIIRTLTDSGYKDLVLDLSECSYIDAAGIGELVSALTFVQDRGGSLAVNCLTRRLRSLFEELRFDSVFQIYNVDHSRAQFIEVQPDKIEPLQRSISFGDGFLDALLTVTAGKVQILPGRQAGLYSIRINSAEYIVAAPYVIANATRSFLADEIGEFEELINDDKCVEADIQRFLEMHPRFLLGQHYERALPQVILDRPEEGPLVPDFMLQPFGSDLCDLVELKLPKAKVLKKTRNRPRFSTAIIDAAAQLRTYRDYFEDPQRRKLIKDRYGITAYRPKVAVIIGRSSPVDPVLYKQMQDGIANVDVITYDEVVQRAKNFLLL
jgi:anti-anti-sigma factor